MPNNKRSYRQERIADELMKSIAEILLFETKDPRLAEVTVTGTKISGDLRDLKVYYFLNDETHHSAIEKCLKQANGFFRKKIAEKLNLKFTPNLTFIFDLSISTGRSIDQLISELKSS